METEIKLLFNNIHEKNVTCVSMELVGISGFFFIISGLRPVKIISLILSQINRKVGRKREIPE